MTDRLNKAIKRILHLNCCEMEGIDCGMPSPKDWEKGFDELAEAHSEAVVTSPTVADIADEIEETAKSLRCLEDGSIVMFDFRELKSRIYVLAKRLRTIGGHEVEA